MTGSSYCFVVQVKRGWSKCEKPEMGRTLREISRGKSENTLKFSLYFVYKSWNVKVVREVFGIEFERQFKRKVKRKVKGWGYSSCWIGREFFYFFENYILYVIIYKKTWIKSLVKSSFKNDLISGMVHAYVEILMVQIL